MNRLLLSQQWGIVALALMIAVFLGGSYLAFRRTDAQSQHFNGRVVYGVKPDTTHWNAGDWARYHAVIDRISDHTHGTDAELEQSAVRAIVQKSSAH